MHNKDTMYPLFFFLLYKKLKLFASYTNFWWTSPNMYEDIVFIIVLLLYFIIVFPQSFN